MMLFNTLIVLHNKSLTKYLCQYLLVINDNFINNNVMLVVSRLTIYIKYIKYIITLKNILPIRAKIPGSFGNFVNII